MIPSFLPPHLLTGTETLNPKPQNINKGWSFNKISDERIYSLAVLQEKIVVTGSSYRIINVLDINNTQNRPANIIKSYDCKSEGVWGLATVDEGKFVSAQANGHVELWDINSAVNHSVTTFLGHGLGIMSITKIDQNLIASGGCDQTIKVWDLRMDASTMSLECMSKVSHVKALKGTTSFVSTSVDSVRLWDLRNPEGLKLLDNRDNLIPICSSFIISRGHDGIEVSLPQVTYAGEFVQGMETLEGQRLLINDNSKTLQIWDLSKDLIKPIKTFDNWDAVSMTQIEGNLVLAGCKDGLARFVDLEQSPGNECQLTLESSSKWCKDVTCIANLGKSLLTGHSLVHGGFFLWNKNG